MEFKIGDQVKWTHWSKSKKSVSAELRKGEIIAIDGDVLTVKRGRRSYQLKAAGVRKIGERSELTEFVTAVFEANREKRGEA